MGASFLDELRCSAVTVCIPGGAFTLTQYGVLGVGLQVEGSGFEEYLTELHAAISVIWMCEKGISKLRSGAVQVTNRG